MLYLRHNMKEISQPVDGGGLYSETDLTRFIAEPFNALSAFIFILIAAYWILELKGSYRQHTFLWLCSLILAVGAVGGTLYHAFRISRIFLLMDWMPIMILCCLAAFYFLWRVLKSWWKALLVFIFWFVLQAGLFYILGTRNRLAAININYAMMALLVLIPLLLFLIRHQFRNAVYVFTALLMFILALFFRIYDDAHWLPMGTHFLWHCFGAMACHLVFLFIYKSQLISDTGK